MDNNFLFEEKFRRFKSFKRTCVLIYRGVANRQLREIVNLIPFGVVGSAPTSPTKYQCCEYSRRQTHQSSKSSLEPSAVPPTMGDGYYWYLYK